MLQISAYPKKYITGLILISGTCRKMECKRGNCSYMMGSSENDVSAAFAASSKVVWPGVMVVVE